MVCDSIPNGVFFQFRNSGLVIEPEEVDYRSNREDYAHCQFVVSEFDGNYIDENYNVAEPVELVIDGHVAHRFYAPNDMIEYRRKMDKPTMARVSLLDAIQVLERGTIEKSWDTATFGELVRYIFENRNDPYDVLKDYTFFVDEDVEETTFGGATVGGIDGPIDEFASGISTEPVLDFITNNVNQLEPISDALFTEPSFDGMSPLAALQKIANTVNQWIHVDDTGTLLIGDFGGLPTVHRIDNTNGLVLSRYDIVASSSMTDAVRVIGGSARKYLKNVDVTEPQGRLRPVAEASVDTISGSPIELSKENAPDIKKVQKISTLRSISVRTLLQELASDSGGSIVINGLASDNKESIAKMGVGHQLQVDPIIGQLCDEVVTTGFFLNTRVQHDMNARRGWSTTVEVSQTAQLDQIDTQTFWYDPQTEQTFDSLTSFNEYYEEEIVGNPFESISNLL